MWLVRFDNFGSVFRLNPPRVSQKSLGLPGRWLPANPLPLTRHGNLKRGKASAGARSIRRMGVWVEVISCCPHAGNACLAVAPMITGCLNLNPAGRAIGRMWRGSRGVVAEGRGEGKRWVTVKPSGFAERRRSRWTVSNAQQQLLVGERSANTWGAVIIIVIIIIIIMKAHIFGVHRPRAKLLSSSLFHVTLFWWE